MITDRTDKPEIWLRTNARLFWVAAVWPVLLAMAGFLLAAGPVRQAWLRGLGWLLAALATVSTAMLIWQGGRPRLARQGEHLLVYLRAGGPLRVPLDVVEGFLVGQAPSFLPGDRGSRRAVKTVVIRLAERASQWAQVDVKPELGSWCGHYVTIRGTWCEPISVTLVERLNTRLAELQRRA